MVTALRIAKTKCVAACKQKKSDREVAKVSEIMGSCQEAVAVKTVVRFKKS